MKSARLLLIATLVAGGCADDPAAVTADSVATLDLLLATDEMSAGDTLFANPVAMDGSGRRIDVPVEWSSGDTSVVSVEAGRVAGRLPGVAWVHARAGAAHDSVPITVTSDGCFRAQAMLEERHPFQGTIFRNGMFVSAHQFSGEEGIGLIFGGGVTIGTTAETAITGFLYNRATSEYNNSVCKASESPLRLVSLLRPHEGKPVIPGLIVREQWISWTDRANNGYMLVAYTVFNRGEQPITGLRVGYFMDPDIKVDAENIGVFDAASETAYAINVDSLNERNRAGIALAGRAAAGFSLPMLGSSGSASGQFDELEPRTLETTRTAVGDVRVGIAPAPITLAPGASETVWFVVAAGRDRAAFERNIAMGRARVTLGR